MTTGKGTLVEPGTRGRSLGSHLRRRHPRRRAGGIWGTLSICCLCLIALSAAACLALRLAGLPLLESCTTVLTAFATLGFGVDTDPTLHPGATVTLQVYVVTVVGTTLVTAGLCLHQALRWLVRVADGWLTRGRQG